MFLCSHFLAYEHMKFNKGNLLGIPECLLCYLKDCCDIIDICLVFSIGKRKGYFPIACLNPLTFGDLVSYWVNCCMHFYTVYPYSKPQFRDLPFLFENLAYGHHAKGSFKAAVFIPSFSNGSTLPPFEISLNIFLWELPFWLPHFPSCNIKVTAALLATEMEYIWGICSKQVPFLPYFSLILDFAFAWIVGLWRCSNSGHAHVYVCPCSFKACKWEVFVV